MAKSSNKDQVAQAVEIAASLAPPAVQEKEIPLSVEEFCLRLSKSDRRVELIGAFFKVETSAGRTKNVESVFKTRFDAFVKQPA